MKFGAILKPVVLLPLECVTWYPTHAHKRDCWGEMASFCKKEEIRKICLNGESDSCFGCCVRVQQLQWQWSIRLEVYLVWLIPGSISTLSLHIYLLVKTSWNKKSCCLDDNFDLRTNYFFGQATASVSVGEVSQDGTECFVCCLLTQQKWIMLIFPSWK